MQHRNVETDCRCANNLASALETCRFPTARNRTLIAAIACVIRDSVLSRHCCTATTCNIKKDSDFHWIEILRAERSRMVEDKLLKFSNYSSCFIPMDQKEYNKPYKKKLIQFL